MRNSSTTLAAESLAEVVDQLPQERDRLLGVMDIARAVLQADDVAGLRDVGQQRIVARILPMMRIEAPEGPADLHARPDHRAVHVDRQAGQPEAGQRLGRQLLVESHQRRQRLLRELPEPVRHGPAGRQPSQPAEARDQRIVGYMAQMLQPPSPP